MRSISVIFITGILSIYVYSICTFESEFLLQISNKMISAISAHLRLATKRFLELIRNKKHVLIEASLYVYYSGSHGNSAFSFGNGFIKLSLEQIYVS